MMALGDNVGKLVKARGLSFGDVARGIGIEDPQAIWALVKRKSKKSAFAGQLADFFGVPLPRLLADDFTVDEASTNESTLDALELEAIRRLRHGSQDWRRYVLGLAMVAGPEQDLLLRTMRQVLPEYKIDTPTPSVRREPLFSTVGGNRGAKVDERKRKKG